MKAGNTAEYYAYGVITFRVPTGHPLKNGNDREKKNCITHVLVTIMIMKFQCTITGCKKDEVIEFFCTISFLYII